MGRLRISPEGLIYRQTLYSLPSAYRPHDTFGASVHGGHFSFTPKLPALDRHLCLCPQVQPQTDDWLSSFHVDGFFSQDQFFPKGIPDSPSPLLWPGCNLSTGWAPPLRYLWSPSAARPPVPQPCLCRVPLLLPGPRESPRAPRLSSRPTRPGLHLTFSWPHSMCFPFLPQMITLTSLFMEVLYKIPRFLDVAPNCLFQPLSPQHPSCVILLGLL